ncbi:MAG: addiction module protein [Propionibacteriaceae bacterium]|jgi:putative addiction module component (TIGR02574 family)|nr:addiction module protein [Propionibacteriaceae bacterium]
MVSSTLRQTVGALPPAELVELRDYIDLSLAPPTPPLTADQQAVVQRRAAELDADPAIGLPWDEVNAELIAQFE